MIPHKETRVDLLAIVSADPVHVHRTEARQLLARARIAYLDIGERDVRGRDFAYRHLDDDVRGPGHELASWYLWYPDRSPESSVPQVPKPRSTYKAVLVDVLARAAALKARVASSTWGEAGLAAARAPFVKFFSARLNAAHYSLARPSDTVGTLRWRHGCSANPGELFTMRSIGWGDAWYSHLEVTNPPLIGVTATGTHRLRFDGHVRSDNTSNPAEVRLAIDVDDVERAVFTASRASADISQSVQFPVVNDDIVVEELSFRAEGIAPMAELTINAGSVITLRNDSTHRLHASGTLRIWRAG